MQKDTTAGTTTPALTAAEIKDSARALLRQLEDSPEAVDELIAEFTSATSPGTLFLCPGGVANDDAELALARAIYGTDHPALATDTGAAETLFQIGDAYLSTTRHANAPEREGLFALAALIAIE